MFLLTLSSSNWKDPSVQEYFKESELPNITIQLPVYNESRVIQQTLSNLTNLLYPRDKLRIQILDDSTDHTSSIIDSGVSILKKQGFNCEVIRRKFREGYKAGALANGVKNGVSEFVAVFDADFIVNENFLMNSIHYFKNNDKIGAVQTRWAHSNLNYSVFTRAMSIGLDGHFLVEKPGRKRRSAFITFNGTGGIWRSSAIDICGGWSSTTLAEDLDLAYRAQMSGYEIIYLRNATNLQEIPPTIRCWIIQQSRWAKGFSQNLRKNFKHFWRNSNTRSRFQGTIHLTQYFVPLLILINTSTSSILLYFPQFNLDLFLIFGLLFSVAAFLGILAYISAILRAKRPVKEIFLVPIFLFWGAGLIVRMALGAIRGIWQKGGEFIKTPKFGLSDDYEGKRIQIREKIPLDKVVIAELLYIVIISLGIIKAVELGISYITQAIYFIFILLSLINLVLSEILHAISTQKSINGN
jgi:cellulose synthase/poly-beta-1,6-N-acetylglucosamine synthase-like glycosyltransferase